MSCTQMLNSEMRMRVADANNETRTCVVARADGERDTGTETVEVRHAQQQAHAQQPWKILEIAGWLQRLVTSAAVVLW